jgi:hypothetical protein
MKKPLRNAVIIALSTALAASTALSVQARETTKPNPVNANQASTLYAVSPNANETFTFPSANASAVEPETKLLGYFDWLQCRQFNNENWVINSFATSYLGTKRNMAIQCGSASTQGYLHIADGDSKHQQGWRNRITQANAADNTDGWDDFMWWSAQQAWNAPEVSKDQGNGKVCRSTPIKMYGRSSNGSLVLKYTFRPSIVWSVSANRLITAIPSTTSTC